VLIDYVYVGFITSSQFLIKNIYFYALALGVICTK